MPSDKEFTVNQYISLKNVLGYEDFNDNQLDEDNYEDYYYDWNRHEKIERLEKRFTKINEIKSFASLSKIDFYFVRIINALEDIVIQI